jgi:Glycosyltransferase like family 2
VKIRVITATRGESPHLAETVAAAAALGPAARHVLVAPAAAGPELAIKFPACVVLPETGGGLYAALNTGLAAPGDEEFVTWINDDDVLVPAGLAAALQLFAADPALGAVYGRVSLIDGTGRRLGTLPVAHRPADLLPLIAAGLMPLAQPGTIFRRSAVAHVGAFDVSFRLAGDLDYFARALRGGVQFAFADAEVAQFRLHGGQLSKDEAAATAEQARIVGALPRLPAGAARWRFRWANLPGYFERVRRHGFVSMQSLYRHA